MSAITFVLGGARSGKSAFAKQLAIEQGGDDVLFIATLRETEAVRADAEMQARLARHRAARPSTWRTLVLEDDLSVIPRALDASPTRCVLLDCLSLYVSGALFMSDAPPTDAEEQAARIVEALIGVALTTLCPWVIVSNEVGMDVAPSSAVARAYRDALGRANQIVANRAARVFFVVAGIPLRLK
ncbi:MAG: bifunctional adenosylcobinamide kinase/adenosylcobinamide-phosphate guanylyltransferase [Thermoflexales bacterium]|nr:bifunctional adenosylcobinamide kinase/adenosylcobinamide-phosphate guanylyltransferase [Thermoflexales bacterium]